MGVGDRIGGAGPFDLVPGRAPVRPIPEQGGPPPTSQSSAQNGIDAAQEGAEGPARPLTGVSELPEGDVGQ